MKRCDELIKEYQLQQHPEGGWFHEEYTSPFEDAKDRACCGSIYFLLKADDISHFHVIDCDEIWYFHEGCGMKITVIDANGKVASVSLGMNLENNEKPMVVLPKGVMFAAENLDAKSYTFVSCATTPKFQYSGFRLVSEKESLADTTEIHHLFMCDEKIENALK